MSRNLPTGRRPDDLSRAELGVVVTPVQLLLDLEEAGGFHPDQEGNSDTVDDIISLLHTFGLASESNSESSLIS